MSNAKVTVPREVAEAIEELRKITATNYELVNVVCRVAPNPKARLIQDWLREKKYSMDTLIDALVLGYEIEKTPEELREIAHGKVRGYYEKLKREEKYADSVWDNEKSWQRFYMRQSVRVVLRMLGIKIEGVNA